MDFIRTRLATKTVEDVEKYLSLGYSYSTINKLTGVSKSSISKIKNGTYKKLEPEYKIENDEKYIKLYQAYEAYKNAYENQKEELNKYKAAYKQLKEKANSMNEELKELKKLEINNICAHSNFFK